MPNYRRWHLGGETYFFTVVAHERRPILASPIGIAALRTAFREVRRKFPFEVRAIVVLPDHLHVIWTMPLERRTRKPDALARSDADPAPSLTRRASGSGDYSTRWSRISTHPT